MKHDVISFDESKIRKIWHNDEWYFSVVDVIGILTESADPKRYWSVLKVREPQFTTVCSSLKLLATDGKQHFTDCANTEGVFRIVMSGLVAHVKVLKNCVIKLSLVLKTIYILKKTTRKRRLMSKILKQRTDFYHSPSL